MGILRSFLKANCEFYHSFMLLQESLLFLQYRLLEYAFVPLDWNAE